jgi:hypothetical protein
MTFRICDNGQRQELPATVESVELTFSPGTHFNDGAEIIMATREHYLMAFVVAGEGDPKEFFLSGKLGETWLVSDQVGRSDALHHFRRFLEAA